MDQERKVDQWDKKKNKTMSFQRIIVIVVIASLIGGGAMGAGYRITGEIIGKYFNDSSTMNNSTDESSAMDQNNTIDLSNIQGEDSVEKIVEAVGPSVVAITTKVQVMDFFRNQTTQQGAGSGVVFDVGEDGIMILTNQHVVDNAQELIVSFEDNVQAEARLVGEDADADLAVVQIAQEDIPEEIQGKIQAVTFGDSDKLAVGEKAIAMGNPLGYNDTVTVGVISALDRELQLADKNLKLIQTDAAINPGNSGGALLNSQGELIGINTVKISDTQVEGIGFAIPINYAKPIIAELLEQGYVSRPYLGIIAEDIDEEMSQIYDIPIGILVRDVIQNSGAHEAGLERGDVIIEIDGDKMLTTDQLTQLITNKKVGDTIQVVAVRNGKERKEMTITLKEKPNE